MKITQEEVADLQTVLNIELEEEDLPPYLDRGYRRVVGRVSIPGFRKGKAPRAIVENVLGRESLIREALDFMVSDVTAKAISRQNLAASESPDVELVDFDPVVLKATVPLRPTVDLGNYWDIRVAELLTNVTDEDVQNRLDIIRQESGSWEPVDRPVALGDMVTIDAAATVEGSEILNESDAVYLADAKNVLPFPGLPQQLEGAETGETREFDLEVPADHESEQIAGKTARFTVTVNDVKERRLPELDDEFARGFADGYDTLDALRESVRERLQGEFEARAEDTLRDDAVGDLVRGATIELPPLSVEREARRVLERRRRVAQMLGVPQEDLDRQSRMAGDELRELAREEAVRSLERAHALSTLAEAEGLKADPEAVEEQVEAVLNSGGSWRRDRPGDVERLRTTVKAELLERESIERLAAIARGEMETDEAGGDEEKHTEGERVDT